MTPMVVLALALLGGPNPDAAVLTAALQATVLTARPHASAGALQPWLLVGRTAVWCPDRKGQLCIPTDLDLPHPSELTNHRDVPPIELWFVRIVTDEAVRRIFERGDAADDWTQFESTFPDVRGYVLVTAPVYDGTSAHVLVMSACGTLCGVGWVVDLQHSREGWRVLNVRVVWVS